MRFTMHTRFAWRHNIISTDIISEPGSAGNGEMPVTVKPKAELVTDALSFLPWIGKRKAKKLLIFIF